MKLALIGILASLAAVIYQDLRYRHINVLLPIAIYLLGFWMASQSSSIILQVSAINSLFLLITFGGMVGYMSIKSRHLRNPFKHYFGLGDLLFLIAITPIFTIHRYITFFIFSLIFSIIVHFAFAKKKDSTIPLAGHVSLCTIIALSIDLFSSYLNVTLIE